MADPGWARVAKGEEKEKENPPFGVFMQFQNQQGGSDAAYVHPETNPEKERIAQRLEGFNPRENQAWKEITRRFGSSIKQPELVSMAKVLATHAKLKVDRDAQRRKTVLLKWFEENWAAVQPFLDYVALEDAGA
jgi:hypothetical protein